MSYKRIGKSQKNRVCTQGWKVGPYIEESIIQILSISWKEEYVGYVESMRHHRLKLD